MVRGDPMPETLKLYSDCFVYEVKPAFDPYKVAKKNLQDFITFSGEFEKRVNEILKDGWTIVNISILNQGITVILTAILKRQS